MAGPQLHHAGKAFVQHVYRDRLSLCISILSIRYLLYTLDPYTRI